MTSVVLDRLEDAWQVDASELWSVSVKAAHSSPAAEGMGMGILAASGAEEDPAPSASRRFTPPLDLRSYTELRFWLRSSRIGGGLTDRPFFLSFEATRDPPDPGTSWSRLLPIERRETWELHRLWLGDMPASLRQEVGSLSLRSLDPTVSFNAAFDSLIACTPEPLGDVDAALSERLHDRFQIRTQDGSAASVPIVLDLPKNPGERELPFILVTPWSIELTEPSPGGEVIDNFGPEGAFVRSRPHTLHLAFRLEVFVQERSQKTLLLGSILSSFAARPYLMVNVERLPLRPFKPRTEQAVPPGRTPLFYRLAVRLDVGEPRFQPHAVPFLTTAPSRDGRDKAEVTAL